MVDTLPSVSLTDVGEIGPKGHIYQAPINLTILVTLQDAN